MEYSKNKFACELLDGQIHDDMCRVIDDIIYYKSRIYLVLESSLKRKIIQASYDSPLPGHQGFLKTYRRIRERFSWKGLKEDVIQHVQECSICQQNKIEHSFGKVTSAITDSGAKMGKHLNGLHYRFTQGTWTRLLICDSILVDQIF